MRRSTKASMQLSINAIVILVMAMAVLGIGLSLIRGVLAPAEDRLTTAIDTIQVGEQATSTKQIANVPSTIKMKNNRDNTVAISFYNAGECASNQNAELAIVCDGTSLPIESAKVPAPVGEATDLIAIVTPEVTNLDTQPCSIQVECNSGSQGPEKTKAVFVDFSS